MKHLVNIATWSHQLLNICLLLLNFQSSEPVNEFYYKWYDVLHEFLKYLHKPLKHLVGIVT